MPVVDTSCLTYLIKINKLLFLKTLFSKIFITEEVLGELEMGFEGVTEIKDKLNDWIFIEEQENKLEALQLCREEGIEYTDALLILVAKKKKDILISNDSALIRIARIKGVECWWFTRCIIEGLKRKLIKKNEAKEILLSLVKNGMYLDNVVFAVLLEKIDKF
ncbi:PIN domain-containing protein [Candidatus Pacearchaeota archaeon]|nr:PIN domain-containing protein [Candidatus Pacearchaeota archaeon]